MEKSSNEDELKGPTLYLALLNFLMYILTSIWGGTFILTDNLPMFYLGISGYTLVHGFIWTPLTSIFVHAGIFHLGGNLIFLFIYGFRIEELEYQDIAVWFGYITTGIVASLISIPLIGFSSISIGASGAVFGLLGINLGIERRSGSVDYKRMGFATIILFIFSNTSANTNIFAHLFGLLCGIFIGSSDFFNNLKK